VAPLLDVVRDQQHVGATSPSPATTRASTHPAQVRRTRLRGRYRRCRASRQGCNRAEWPRKRGRPRVLPELARL